MLITGLDSARQCYSFAAIVGFRAACYGTDGDMSQCIATQASSIALPADRYWLSL